MGEEGGPNYKFGINPDINVLKLELEPIFLSKNESWFKLGNNLICIKFSKKTVEISIVKENNDLDMYIVNGGLDCNYHSIKIDDLNICNELSQIIDNYEKLVKQFEILEKARATRLLNYTTVPSLPKEWEILIYSISRKLMDQKIIKTFYLFEGNREVVLGIHCYENGYYRECEDTLKHEITRLLETSRLLDIRLIPSLTGIIVKNIEIRTMEYYRPAKRCLLFKNKIFSWDKFLETRDIELSLIEPNPEIIVTHRIPWELKPELFKIREGLLKYIPPSSVNDFIELFKALAPKSFKAFLDWVKKPGESEETAYPRVLLLLEIIGYTLYPHEYPFHKAILLVGEGLNGKTTFLKLIETILSKPNVSGVSLCDLDPRVNRFAPADLYNKLANISSEPPRKHLDPTLFKSLTGEDLVRVERKFRDSFTTHNYAKLIFSANELPMVTEDTFAFWRRWIVIEFPNRFAPDPGFFDRTFTPDEIEAIILLSLHAFRNVLERKSFTESGVDDIREEWLSRSNPVYRVVKKMIEDGIIELDPKAVVIKSDLYALYKKYVEILNGEGYEIIPLEQKDFTKSLTRYFPVKSGVTRIEGKSRNVYFGVKIKNYEKALELVGSLETPRDLL
ncbi:MAG: DUF5906 domain-containing protein [Desulfurococcaceae archaeon]